MFTRVRGNTILFAMPLQGKTFYAGAIVVDDFVPQEGDEITVVMQDRRAYTYTPTYTDGMLIWTDNGQLEVGTYSVEVLVDRQDGTHLRCLRVNQVNIVESTEESELDSNDSENGVYPSDILSAGVFLFAGNGNLGIREIAQDVFDTSIGPIQTAIVNGYTALIGTSLRNVVSNMWETLSGNSGDYANRLIDAHHIPLGSGLAINVTTGRIDVTGGGGGGGGAVNSVAGLTGDITALALFDALGLGDAAKRSIGSVAEGNTGLVTGGDVFEAIGSGSGGVGVNDVKFGDTTVPAEKDKLVVTKGNTDYYRDILFAQVAQKTRFTYTAGGTTYTNVEFPIDWLIAEEYTAGHYRLRVNPKYEGLYADGWVAAGGIGSGGGGGGGTTLNQPLSAINSASLGAPSVNNSVIGWDSTYGWCYMTPAILGTALAKINSDLSANPVGSNKTIVWDGSSWSYGDISGGGGGVTLNEPLASINNLGAPSASNVAIVWNGSAWGYASISGGGGGGTGITLADAWNSLTNAISDAYASTTIHAAHIPVDGTTIAVNNGVIGVVNNGTVTSVGLSVPTGFEVSGTPITASGTLAISFASGYSLPTTAKQGEWDSAASNVTTLMGRTNWDDYLGVDASGNVYVKKDSNNNARGFYSYGFVAAGGVGSGGGGGVSLNEPLSGINSASLGAPLTPDVGLKWNGTAWVYASWGSSVSAATTSDYGTVKLGTSTVLTIDASSKVYPIGMTSSGQLAVEVPWVSGGGGGGSTVSWGTAGADYVPLTVDGVKKNLLTSHQSLSGYATQSWVGNQGYITGITSSMVTTALGFTPISSSALSGYATESWVTGKGYLTGITSAMVTTALGFTPISSSALSGYATESWVTGKGYLTSAVTSLNTLTGAVTLSNGSNVSITKSGSTITIAATDTNTTYKLSLNGTVNGDSTNGTNLGTFYAPTSYGTSGYVLIGQGSGSAPVWSSALYVSSGNTVATGSVYIGGTTAYIRYASGGLNTNVGFSSDSYIAAGGIGSSSDRRLKDDLQPVSSDRALSVLMQLKPMEWVWNEKNSSLSGKRSAGLVAQDVMDVLPFAVTDSGDYYSLLYPVFHAYEIAGLQNHEERISELEKRLEYAAR